MIRSQRSLKASHWLMTLILSAAALWLTGCGDDEEFPWWLYSGGSGDTTRVVYVFLTELSYDGAFGGLSDADDICTAEATDSGFTDTWTAWLSSSTEDARDRIQDAEYRLLDGTVVANDKADLTDGTLDAPINVDVNGLKKLPGQNFPVWTGTAPDGTNFSRSTCQDWTSNLAGVGGQAGRLQEVDDEWTDSIADSCDAFNRFYCFRDESVVVKP